MADPEIPTVDSTLTWTGDLRFEATAGAHRLAFDGDGHGGASPVTTLVAALGACMAMDVVHVLRKARLPLEGLTVHAHAERSPTHPRRVRRAELRFVVKGDVPAERVERAIALSRETYCSVWASLAADVELTTTVASA